jgi:hypothetical protein
MRQGIEFAARLSPDVIALRVEFVEGGTSFPVRKRCFPFLALHPATLAVSFASETALHIMIMAFWVATVFAANDAAAKQRHSVALRDNKPSSHRARESRL